MDIVIHTCDPDVVHVDLIRLALEEHLNYFVGDITVVERSL